MKRPTWTSQVVEALGLFDQLTGRELMALLGASASQVSATLHDLEKYGVVGQAGTRKYEPLWALTGADERVRAREEQKIKTISDRRPGKQRNRHKMGTYVALQAKTIEGEINVKEME